MKEAFALLVFVCVQAACAQETLPRLADKILAGQAPEKLSETHAFTDLRKLSPRDDFMPYELNVPFWSDGANKQRWVYVPKGKRVVFSPANEWRFPAGTLFMKQFSFPVDERDQARLRRLETRFTVVSATGGVVGVTYRWQNDGTDAELLRGSFLESFTIASATGMRTQSWYYPSQADCTTCHTPLNGGVLGLNARQLNRDFVYENQLIKNQLVHWQDKGLFLEPGLTLVPGKLPRLVEGHEPGASVGQRARSWLDANCAHCHRPGGTIANFDARFDTGLASQNLINGPILIDEGIDNARVIAPRDIWRSILFLRTTTLEAFKMPPLAHEQVDAAGVALLREWIESMPGPIVLSPPRISPAGGDFDQQVQVKLSHETPDVVIRYTVDGSAPGKNSSVYSEPIRLAEPATVRARAYKVGFTRSICVQETFIVNPLRASR
jgi:uncharacterized repeat protein (TIGR03806 family)